MFDVQNVDLPVANPIPDINEKTGIIVVLLDYLRTWTTLLPILFGNNIL